ncbi:MAG TPA: S8 family serine peptidase [Gaiellaceae bacterium]|nr:S8 family serine peptidase [Gaiellaceae bacterium]
MTSAGAATERGSAETARYIVRLADAPLATYTGGVDGLAATTPAATGEAKLDPTSAASRAYLQFLAGKQATFERTLLTALGRKAQVDFRYRHAYNGLAVRLTGAEAERVAQLPGVASVRPDFQRQITSDVGPAWIGAPAVWNGTATGGASGTKGEGVVVGVIDTGINHDHPSFAARGGDGYVHRNPRGRFYGLCDPVLGTPTCNAKLIGVWDFTGGVGEDDNGHGSHTASTAAGNVVDARMVAPTLTIERRLSGVAPHANLISYKACLAVGSCLGASLVAAIDQATADAVDVINYSIGGGPSDPWHDSDAEAFLAARAAGIFVATSAGNSGSKPETIGSPANAPWLLAVGAATHNRTFANAVSTVSGGATTPPGELRGAGVTAGYGPAPIVHAADYGDRLCSAPFAPGTFDGEIVICDRGINPRVEKGTNVKLGGAGGMVLVNTAAEGESTVGDAHNLPAVHLGYTAGRKLTEWVASGSGHTARITGSVIDESPSNGDVTAGFSSRGPNKPVPGVLKPDVTAPGVDVLAAVHTVAPTSGPEYGILSGTSMSSPHAAGAAALVRAVHRTWTPAEVQSALMTTALTSVRDDDGVKAADAFDMGAGRIDLTKAARAGLTLDVPIAEYAAADPSAGGDPTALNLASLAASGCEGTCSWKRSVTSRAGVTTTWRAKTSGPRDLRLAVSPSSFTLAPGATQTITVTADVSKLALGQWLHAALVLEPGTSEIPAARMPIAIRTGELQSVDAESAGTTGSTKATVVSKVDVKDLQTVVSGLTKGLVTNELLVQDPTPLDPYDSEVGTFTVTVDVPAGARLVAAEIVDTTSLDLDLFVGIDENGDGVAQESEEVCASASDTAFESCTLSSPAGGTYWVMVQNWLGFGVDEVELATAVVGGTDAGNLSVSGPKSVKAGVPFEVTLSWNVPSMATGDTWFGLVELGTDKRHPNNAKSLFVTLRRTS